MLPHFSYIIEQTLFISVLLPTGLCLFLQFFNQTRGPLGKLKYWFNRVGIATWCFLMFRCIDPHGHWGILRHFAIYSYCSCNTTALLFVAVAQAVFYSLGSTRTLVQSNGNPVLYYVLVILCVLTFLVGNATTTVALYLDLFWPTGFYLLWLSGAFFILCTAFVATACTLASIIRSMLAAESSSNTRELTAAARSMRQFQIFGCLIIAVAIPCQAYFGLQTVKLRSNTPSVPLYQPSHGESYHSEDAVFLILQILGCMLLLWWCWQPISRSRLCGITLMCNTRSGRCACVCTPINCMRQCGRCLCGTCCIVEVESGSEHSMKLPISEPNILPASWSARSIPGASPALSTGSGNRTRGSSIGVGSRSASTSVLTTDLMEPPPLPFGAPEPDADPYDDYGCCCCCGDICSRCCYLFCGAKRRRELQSHAPLLSASASYSNITTSSKQNLRQS